MGKVFRFTLILAFAICLCVLCFSKDAYAQSHLSPKDTNLAITLSIIDPSFGMFYLGYTDLGMLYWALDKASFITTVLLVFDISISFPPNYGLNIDIKLIDFNVLRVVSASVIGAFYLGLRIFAIIDSRKKTLEYNKVVFEDKVYLMKKEISNNNDNDLRFFIMTDKLLGMGLRLDF